MYDRILLPTDESAGANRAIEYALGIAKHTNAAVDALYVLDTRIEYEDDAAESLLSAVEKQGRAAVNRIVDRAEGLGIEARSSIRRGVPYEEIVTCAEERNADLIAMGTRGVADHNLGSSAERVVTLADAAVLTVRGADPGTSDSVGSDADGEPAVSSFENVLVPVDGSANAERAAEHAVRFADRFDATVHALYVVDESIYALEDAPRSIVGLLREGGEKATADVVSLAEEADVPARSRVRRGRPNAEILEYADTIDADLLVMGTRGRSGLPERLLGSTTRRTVAKSNRPVTTVK